MEINEVDSESGLKNISDIFGGHLIRRDETMIISGVGRWEKIWEAIVRNLGLKKVRKSWGHGIANKSIM